MDKCITLSFGKDITSTIKGIAIIFMIMLHCVMADVLKLCVGIFTFMVGYGYAFSKKKDWRYNLSHVWKILLPFWIVLIVFTLPVIIATGELVGRGEHDDNQYVWRK